MNDKVYPTMVIRNQAEAIELLEKQNVRLKNELEKQDIDYGLEIERLNKRAKECEEAYLRTRQQYSELENKYLTDEYIINKLEKWLVEWREMLDCPDFYEEGIIDCINDTLTKLQELKGDSSNE